MRLAVLVPVKRFTAAKRRLADVLADEPRERLARWMAARVVDVAAETPTFVACDDDEVAGWAERTGATVLWGPGLGLNGAVDDGVGHIARAGYDHVLITHADLPRPTSLLDVPTAGAVTLVPDRRYDGTNVMSFPLDHPVTASYGGGSFGRHLEQAVELGARFGVHLEVRHDHDLSLDLDTVRDLDHPKIREVLPSWLPTNRDNR